MELKQVIKQLTLEQHDKTIGIYQYLHQHPELSFQEYNTSSYIQEQLTQLNIPFQAGYAQTGIIAHIKGELPGNKKVVGLRADMDALPIQENQEHTCRSQNTGVMHACGHDVHMASLLGAAAILKQLTHTFSGAVLLIFQPGEESHPGGARLLLKEGALDNPRPDIIIGQHVLPELPVGQLAFKTGCAMASADEIYITVKGKGGHAALPHLCNDTVLTAARILVALQDITSRMLPAQVPTILSFGKLIADGATNIIPNEVRLSGTLRTTDETCRTKAKELIRHVSSQVAISMGCTCEFDIKDGFPCVINDKDVTERAIAYSEKFLGEEHVERMPLRMTAEDFGFYSQAFPCTFFRIGVKSPQAHQTGGLHTPHFVIDTDVFKTSVSNFVNLAISFLQDE